MKKKKKMLKTKEHKVWSVTDLETEVHRGEAICPRTSKQEVEARLVLPPSNLV